MIKWYSFEINIRYIIFTLSESVKKIARIRIEIFGWIRIWIQIECGSETLVSAAGRVGHFKVPNPYYFVIEWPIMLTTLLRPSSDRRCTCSRCLPSPQKGSKHGKQIKTNSNLCWQATRTRCLTDIGGKIAALPLEDYSMNFDLFLFNEKNLAVPYI